MNKFSTSIIQIEILLGTNVGLVYSDAYIKVSILTEKPEYYLSIRLTNNERKLYLDFVTLDFISSGRQKHTISWLGFRELSMALKGKLHRPRGLEKQQMDYGLCWIEPTHRPLDTGCNFHAIKCLAMAPEYCSLTTFFVCSTKVHCHEQIVTGLHFLFFICTFFFHVGYNLL